MNAQRSSVILCWFGRHDNRCWAAQAAQLASAGDAGLRRWCPLSLMALVKGLKERCDDMRPVVERFCFVVPRVMSSPPKVSEGNGVGRCLQFVSTSPSKTTRLLLLIQLQYVAWFVEGWGVAGWRRWQVNSLRNLSGIFSK